ncbi:MAG: flagellar biosynthesis anti-sigma factor FlgM [Solirubrobacterales bacterium]|nr:flagellar biosynthesis anti-sigma factor FlgM [Solirubrobacterales bacterium]
MLVSAKETKGDSPRTPGRIAHVRGLISQGHYRVDSERVAEAMVERMRRRVSLAHPGDQEPRR